MTDDENIDHYKAIWNHRPSMTYEGLKLVFNEVGDLVISEEAREAAVTIPDWQLDLVLAFIKRHRLSPTQTVFARRYPSNELAGQSEPAEDSSRS